jgi:hypothetical protein
MRHNLPVANHFLDVRMLVYTAIIHDNYRIRRRIRLHVVKKPFYEVGKGFSTKRTLYNVTMKNAIIQ